MQDEAAERARRTYDAAADHFDALDFWARLSARVVDRLDLRAGSTVLDTPCGTGASALPAARVVGPAGSVVGADVSASLLGLARAKASAEGLTNITFRSGDMRSLGYPDASFDTVICVFGVFFVDDMPGLVRELWRMVRPGGTLAVTTWGVDALEPAAGSFWDAVGEIRPDLVRGFNPWDTIVTTEALAALFATAGIDRPETVAEDSTEPVATPDEWWRIVLGTGFRATTDALGDGAREHVRERTLAALVDEHELRTPVVHGSALKRVG